MSVTTVLEYVRSNPAAVALIGGFITPLVIAVLQQPQLAKWQRTAVSVAASVVLGGGAALSTGLFDSAGDVLTVIAVLYTASEAAYQRLWKQSGLTDSIEAATSPKSLSAE